MLFVTNRPCSPMSTFSSSWAQLGYVSQYSLQQGGAHDRVLTCEHKGWVPGLPVFTLSLCWPHGGLQAPRARQSHHISPEWLGEARVSLPTHTELWLEWEVNMDCVKLLRFWGARAVSPLQYSPAVVFISSQFSLSTAQLEVTEGVLSNRHHTKSFTYIFYSFLTMR